MRVCARMCTFHQGDKRCDQGRVAEAIVSTVQSHGGLLTADDLASHQSTFDAPICVSYRGHQVWEMPPNGQGLTALLALNILEGIDIAALKHNSPAYLHTLIEALRLSFADTRYYVADPKFSPAPLSDLLSAEYAAKRRALLDSSRAIVEPATGSPGASSDTVYFTAVDRWGNACSFINSNYMGFGTGIVPPGCGFTLQVRQARARFGGGGAAFC
jgi:gamma-glutamyltranspeptidase/glutathione hydrolase